MRAARKIDSELGSNGDVVKRPLAPVIEFNGQQEGERVLHFFLPHSISYWFSMSKLLFSSAILLMAIWLVNEFFLSRFSLPNYIGFSITALYTLIGIWWLNRYHNQARVYITDRRIVRFEPIFPIFKQKRILFWANVLKTKAVSQNFFMRLFKIGTVVVSPVSGDSEDIKIKHVYYYEDVVNYLDKILYLAKNNPSEIASVKGFVLKPKGQRY